MKSIINGNVFYKNHFHHNLVVIFDEFIKEIVRVEDYKSRCKDHDYKEIDAKQNYVVPGFIDVHIHGYGGADVMDGQDQSLTRIASGITANGVTAFLATTMTMEQDKIEKALEMVKKRISNKQCIGEAMILGVHLEGPFISKEYKGAQRGDCVVSPDIEWLDKYSDIIKVVTIAPEVEGAMDMIKGLSHKINFSLGHTGADYKTAQKAYENGAKSATHLFNAMTGLHHRNPGVVGAALSGDSYCELIADKFHVHPDLFETILKAKSSEKLLLITDCIQAGGLEDGEYDLGGQAVKVAKGQCHLQDGTIAGSVLKLHDGLKNFTQYTGNHLAKTLCMVTSNQADYLGLRQLMGDLDRGKLANIVIMTKDIEIKETYVKGNKVYENQL